MNKTLVCYLLVLTATAVCLASVNTAFAQIAPVTTPVQMGDAAAIRHALKATWDKPGQPLLVEPIVTDGQQGIAGWVQGDRGGRALLQRRAGVWKVIACGGDGLKSATTLKETGMPARTAARLAQMLASAEAKLPEQTRKNFSLFDGVVRMDSSRGGAHP
jgi:hypothetical protein